MTFYPSYFALGFFVGLSAILLGLNWRLHRQRYYLVRQAETWKDVADQQRKRAEDVEAQFPSFRKDIDRIIKERDAALRENCCRLRENVDALRIHKQLEAQLRDSFRVSEGHRKGYEGLKTVSLGLIREREEASSECNVLRAEKVSLERELAKVTDDYVSLRKWQQERYAEIRDTEGRASRAQVCATNKAEELDHLRQAVLAHIEHLQAELRLMDTLPQIIDVEGQDDAS